MQRASSETGPGTASGPPSTSVEDAFAGALARLDAGTPWRRALEGLLLDLPYPEADRVMQLLREARGAWVHLLAGRGGPALFVGDPLSGTVAALARAGYDVVVLAAEDVADDTLRLRLAAHRDAAGARRPVRRVRARPDALPFARDSFELVVLETGGPGGGALAACAPEARRVGRGELVLTAENRLGYKRSTGRRGDFRVPGPLEYAARVLTPSDGSRTLAGYRRALAADGFRVTRSLALYPHLHDFALVADLGDPGQEGGLRLPIGPKERENRLKVAAFRLGLFPHLTPSYCVVASRAAPAPTRLGRILDRLAAETGEPRPRAEELVATRGNTSVIHAGTWTLHLPHSHHQRIQAERHFERIGEVRARFPGVPVPEPLFRGELEGMLVCCERRVPGLHAPQLVGRHAVMGRMLADAARILAQLVIARVELDEQRFAHLVTRRVDLVRATAAVPSTIAALDRMHDAARERLLGSTVPLVLHHADLRSKHVMIQEDGTITGLLDWGSSESEDLPWFDLLHLLIHERKQEHDSSAGDAWRAVRAGDLRDHEAAALEDYAARLELAPEVRHALLDLYPVFVGAMAEAWWDYSRPRWLHRSFGL